MKEKRELVKVEGNLIEYPFFHLGGRKNIVVSKKYEIGDIVLENGTTVKRKLTIENINGIPGPYDQDVLMGILRIGTKKNKLTEDIPLTVYEVAKEIGDIRNRMRIRKSIEKLTSTTYISKQVVLVKENNTKYYLDDIFHILESATFLDKATHENTRKSNEITKVRFNKFFINNFLNDYYKYVDLKKYFEIGSPTAKKLYLYLEKKKFKKDFYQIKLDNLARILPIESNKHYQIRWILKKAHEKLIEHSIIKSFKYDKDKVVYFFPAGKKEEPLPEKHNNEILEELINKGITKIIAEETLKKYDHQKIKQQIEYLKFRKGNNLQGILISSIKEDWAAPPQHLKETKRKEDIEKKEQEKEIEKKTIKKKKEQEEEINKVISGLTNQERDEYNKRAEEIFKKDNPELKTTFFGGAYRDTVIKKLILKDKGVCPA